MEEEEWEDDKERGGQGERNGRELRVGQWEQQSGSKGRGGQGRLGVGKGFQAKQAWIEEGRW